MASGINSFQSVPSDGNSGMVTESPYPQSYSQDLLNWQGGEHHFEGEHDDWCFTCGFSKGLLECQTCDRSYHAECTSSAMAFHPEASPAFLFCPNCVTNNLHMPPDLLPLSPSTWAGNTIGSTTPGLVTSTSNALSNESPPNDVLPDPQYMRMPALAPQNVQNEAAGPANHRVPASQLQPKPPGRELRPKTKAPGKVDEPPRKRSKYSSFSSDIDKALSVIYAELESASQAQKVQDDLSDKVKTLEQRLTYGKNEVRLSRQEVTGLKSDLLRERTFSDELTQQKNHLREEVSRLTALVQSKEDELEDWRKKLRSMLGNASELF